MATLRPVLPAKSGHIGPPSRVTCALRWDTSSIITKPVAAKIDRGSSNGRTADFESANLGSSPSPRSIYFGFRFTSRQNNPLGVRQMHLPRALWYDPEVDEDQVIVQRISGRSVRAIAKQHGCSVAEINAVIDNWASSSIDDQIRKHTLCLDLARLDELQQVFHQRALQGDVACGALITKIIRRCVMLGLATPQTAVLQIVDCATPKQTSTDKIEAAIRGLLADQDREDDPTTH